MLAVPSCECDVAFSLLTKLDSLSICSSGPYDWYQSYQSVRHLLSIQALVAATKLDLDKAFPTYDKCRVLILGCGNSTFGEDMIRDGWKGPITNVDFSSVAIEQMKMKYCNTAFTEKYDCPEMKFIRADISKGLPFDDKSFDLIICKGTFDAILCSAGSVASAKTVVAECSRVLVNGHGVLFLVSYGNPDSRVVFLEHENDLSFYWKEVSIHNVGRKQQGR
jgi:SAM-dependent methyltransferase